MNRRMLRANVRVVGLLGLVTAVAGPCAHDAAAAPQDPGQLVEGVVAVVGDTAITWTELQEFTIQLQTERGMEIPQDPDEYRSFLEYALNEKINEVVLYLHAVRAGVVVSDREVDEIVDDQLAQVRRNFPSDADFQQAVAATGLTMAEYRIRWGERTRVQLIWTRYLQQQVGRMQPLPVSEAEIREFFEGQQEHLGPRPATVSLKQVIVRPQPSEEARLAARERADQVYSRLRAGEDFAVIARELSDDATRDQGGLLGWVRQGQLLPEFDEALYRMRPGQISSVVETAVGYHIIKLERVRGAERLARHVLLRMEVTEEDVEAARQLAEEVAAALRDGADPDSLINEHGDPDEESTLTNYPRDRLPGAYPSELEGTVEGDVVGPFLLLSESFAGRGKWVVALISQLRPAGEWTFDDVRETYRQQILQEKMLAKLINDLREATYIETRLDQFPAPG